jgi:hypothetical protein
MKNNLREKNGAIEGGQRHCEFFEWTWQLNNVKPRPFTSKGCFVSFGGVFLKKCNESF